MNRSLNFALFAPVVLLAACGTHRDSSVFTMMMGGSGGSSYYQRLGEGPVRVAFLRNGEIVGLEGATSEDLDHWPAGSYPMVSHPDIPVWREDLAWLRSLQTDGAAPVSAAEFVERAGRFPFDAPVEAALTAVVSRQPEAAPALLDAAEELDIEDAVAETVARQALAQPIEDGRLAKWLSHLIDEDEDRAAMILIDHPAFGRASLDAVFDDLGDVHNDLRRDMFVRLASRFASDPSCARTIVASVDELRSRDEGPALVQVLEQGSPSPDLLDRVLREIDEFVYADRTEILLKVTDRLSDPNHYRVSIGEALTELPYDQRTGAACRLVDHPAARADLIVELVEQADELPYGRRAEFLEHVLQVPVGADPSVHRAIERACADCLGNRDAERVRARLGRG